MATPMSTATHLDNNNLQPRGPYTDLQQLLRLRFIGRELKLFANRASRAPMSGNVRTRFRGRGMEFEEVRLYQAGDDVRNIDWRVTARTQVPHTKLFHEERERPVYIVLDQRQPMFFGSTNCFKSVLAVHIAAVLGWSALQQGDRVGGMVFGNNTQDDIRPRRSRHAQMELLHAAHNSNSQLQRPTNSEQWPNLTTMLTDVRRIAKPGCAVFFISDFQDLNQETEAQCHLLAQHTDLTLIAISDPLESNLPQQAGQLTISNGVDRLSINSKDARVQRLHQSRFDSRSEQLSNIANALKIAHLSFSTGTDPNALLRQHYSSQRRR